MTIFEESEGVASMRRVLAFVLAIASIALFAGGFFFANYGWIVFVPGFGALAGCLLLLFFTTWADIKGIVSALKGKGE